MRQSKLVEVALEPPQRGRGRRTSEDAIAELRRVWARFADQYVAREHQCVLPEDGRQWEPCRTASVAPSAAYVCPECGGWYRPVIADDAVARRGD